MFCLDTGRCIDQEGNCVDPLYTDDDSDDDDDDGSGSGGWHRRDDDDVAHCREGQVTLS